MLPEITSFFLKGKSMQRKPQENLDGNVLTENWREI